MTDQDPKSLTGVLDTRLSSLAVLLVIPPFRFALFTSIIDPAIGAGSLDGRESCRLPPAGIWSV